LSIKPSKTTNSYTASGFDDVIDGLEFFPTFHFDTPCEVLRAYGMRVDTEEQIPDFLKSQVEGVWIPKVKNECRLDGFDNEDVGASDAFGVRRDDYIAYVCSIKDIYSSGRNIFERVDLINKYREEHKDLLYVEDKLLNSYRRNSIIDVLMFITDFSFKDLVCLRFRDNGYLKPILGVNTRIEKSLISAGFQTVENIVNASKEQLVKLDGVGSKSADKILDKIAEVKAVVTEESPPL